jgi:hypothetical protein
MSSFAENWSFVGGVPAGRVIATYDVPVVTLDSAIERFGTPVFCKIDVEGWELEVLTGLTQPIPVLSFEFQLTDHGIRKTIACLEKLAQFGASRVNITPAETSLFHFRDWVPLSTFIAWFPGNLEESLPGEHYGDIFVRREATLHRREDFEQRGARFGPGAPVRAAPGLSLNRLGIATADMSGAGVIANCLRRDLT